MPATKDVDSAQTACYDTINQLVYFQAEALPPVSSDDADTTTTLAQFSLLHNYEPVAQLQPFSFGFFGFFYVPIVA